MRVAFRVAPTPWSTDKHPRQEGRTRCTQKPANVTWGSAPFRNSEPDWQPRPESSRNRPGKAKIQNLEGPYSREAEARLAELIQTMELGHHLLGAMDFKHERSELQIYEHMSALKIIGMATKMDASTCGTKDPGTPSGTWICRSLRATNRDE